MRVFENVLTENHRDHIYMFAIAADYKIGWDDTSTFEHRQYPCLHHEISFADWRELDFFEGIIDEDLKQQLSSLSFKKAVINLATPSAIQYPHTHGDMFVLTYYLNPEWKNEYYGETVFYDEALHDCTRSVAYRPNGCVFFDGVIPHAIRPASHIAPSYRFTLSVFFSKKNFIEEAKNST
tara:strand:- start:641 stop:1180 length:540 start_codon:yes stop_codon:yes gene_type:complete